ncbi:MAG: sulfotransferase [Marinicella sp.]
MKFINKNEKHLLFVVGMQKSGTSLLNQILMKQDFIRNPFLPEGKFFWGDDPPFSPKEYPCGEIYQKHDGMNGHYMGENDFKIEQQKVLRDRIAEANVEEPVLLNKNPYNSVRIEWLRKVFPNCTVVAVYRNPVSNIFSLLKKFVISGNVGLGPEEGWWGIKPKNWRNYIEKNKLVQCCHQWNLTNLELMKNHNQINLWFEYAEICKQPNKVLQLILSVLELDLPLKKIEKLKCFDTEYLKGSRIVSKNSEFRAQQSFDLSKLEEETQFGPLNTNQIDEILLNCNPQWISLKQKNNGL